MAEERCGFCSSEVTKSAPFFCLPGHSFYFSGGEEKRADESGEIGG